MSSATSLATPSMRQRNLAGACLAHLLHDGYTDQLYALLPVWQPEFGLSYAGLAMLRALYSATMGGLQYPMDRWSARISPRFSLVLASFIAASGYALMALPLGFAGLCAGLVISGIGSSLQHPRASALVTASYGVNSRSALGIYNFAGDLGKSTFPAAVALLLPFAPWRPVVGLTALAGVVIATALVVLLPRQSAAAAAAPLRDHGGDGKGFFLLLAIGACDTATRMGYLLFLPFLVTAKGGHESEVGLALALLFIGGALGKACCGWLGQRFGVVACVIATEAATAVLILSTLVLPFGAMLAMLPLLGIVLNGTSSVLYGTVPELARRGKLGHAFALFYTGVIGAGGLSPIGYGIIADHAGKTIGIAAAAVTAAAIIPLVLLLARFLKRPSVASGFHKGETFKG